MNGQITTVIFDLGNVLIDWNPRYLYRRLFAGDEHAVDKFLSEICTTDWNYRQDQGRSFAEAEEELIARHPRSTELIRAWRIHYDEMMKGPIGGSVSILSELRSRDVPLYALTNWSAETFHFAEKRFDFLDWFRGIVISGREKIAKPDPRIYRILLERYSLNPITTAFIDDKKINADAANSLGIKGIIFESPDILRTDLIKLGLLDHNPHRKQACQPS